MKRVKVEGVTSTTSVKSSSISKEDLEEEKASETPISKPVQIRQSARLRPMMKSPGHRSDEGVPSVIIDLSDNDEEDESTGMGKKHKGKQKMTTSVSSDDGNDEIEEAEKTLESEPSENKSDEKATTTEEHEPEIENKDVEVEEASEPKEEKRNEEILAET